MNHGLSYNQPWNYHFNHNNNDIFNHAMNNPYQQQNYSQSSNSADNNNNSNFYQTFAKNTSYKLPVKNISSPLLNMNYNPVERQQNNFGADSDDNVFRKTMIKNPNTNPLQSSSYNIINNLPYKINRGTGIGLYENRTGKIGVTPERKKDYFSDILNYDPIKENSYNGKIQQSDGFFGNTMSQTARKIENSNNTMGTITNNNNNSSNKINVSKLKLDSPSSKINIGSSIHKVITGLSQEIQSKSSEPFLRQIPFIRHSALIGQTSNNYDNNTGSNRVYIEKSSLYQPYYYEKNCASVIEYAYKEDQNSRFRSYMEDKGKAVDCFKNNPNDGLFCLFDGHGGGEVSKFLQEKFPNYFKEVLPSDNLESTFVNLFNKIDLDIKSSNFNNVGATACIIFITKEKNNRVIYSANIGDTRSVLVNSYAGKRLSYDHRASDKSEHMRIVNEGGIVYAGRVYGQLMLSRAFGDWELKPYGVSNIPYVSRTEITAGDKYLIIGTDGIYDVFTDHEIYQLSLEISNAEEYCNTIMRTAQLKGTMDNISCFVLKLHL